MVNNLKIQSKLIVYFLIPSLCLLVLVGLFSYWISYENLKKYILKDFYHQLETVSTDLNMLNSRVYKDLLFESNAPTIKGLVNSLEQREADNNSREATNIWIERATLDFVNLLKSNKYYHSLRFIDKNGNELVRVDKLSNNIDILSGTERLQNKADTQYFKFTKSLAKDSVYVSPLNLNREYGMIQEPHIPVFRISKPVYNSKGNFQGITIINVNANKMMSLLGEMEMGTLMLLNQDGYYLYHPDKQKTFGFDLEHQHQIEKDYPGLLPEVLGHSLEAPFLFETNEGQKIFTSDIIYYDPDNKDDYWILLWMVPEKQAMQVMNEFSIIYGIIFLVGLILTTVLLFVISRQVKKPVIDLIEATKKLSSGKKHVQLEVKSNDELGELTRSFNEMVIVREQSESESFKFLQVTEQTPSSIIITDKDGIIEYVNPRFSLVSGYSKEETIGKHVFTNHADEGNNSFEEIWESTLKDTERENEFRNRKKNGEYYWESIIVSPVFSKDKKITHFIVLKQDISAQKTQKEDQKKLINELEYQKVSIDKAAIVSIADARGRITYSNEMFSVISKYSKEELLGKDHRIVNSGIHSKDYVEDMWKTIARGNVWKGEFQNKNKEGNYYWVDTTIVPFLNENGTPEKYLAIRFDITAHKLLELDILTRQKALDHSLQLLQKSDVLKTGQTELNEIMRGQLEIKELSHAILEFLVKFCQAQIGSFYLSENTSSDKEQSVLKLYASHALSSSGFEKEIIHFGEGLVGQAALNHEIVSIMDAPNDYMNIKSSIGSSAPQEILVCPFLFENELSGVIELGSFENFSDGSVNLLKVVKEHIGIAINTAKSRSQTKTLLEKTQNQTEELQVQQEELRVTNEELKENSDYLEKSQTLLKEQQEELQVTNEELHVKSTAIQMQYDELKAIRLDLEKQASELQKANTYKSEFLANMSHELRTPLNSLLILSQNLAENNEGNLTEDQTEAAEIIHEGGKELLELINDILDLSKIEAGMMEVTFDPHNFKEIVRSLNTGFKLVAENKGISFDVKLDESLPKSLNTDRMRLHQVLKNLISNALKFTSSGGVTINIHAPAEVEIPKKSMLVKGNTVSFSVTDTGIGIPKSKQNLIFTAFQQADGSTVRQYGGTGLGLSISRQLSSLLQGELTLNSEENKGSTFSFLLPLEPGASNDMQKNEDVVLVAQSKTAIESTNSNEEIKVSPDKQKQNNKVWNKDEAVPKVEVIDEINNISESDRVILIIEDDVPFSKILEKQCLAKNFKALLAETGEDGLKMAAKYKPYAIILDIKLPGIPGWKVLESLKEDKTLRHIPVHMMSSEQPNIDAVQKGAFSFVMKPINKNQMDDIFVKLENFIDSPIKQLLVIQHPDHADEELSKFLGGKDVQINIANTGKEAISLLTQENFHCMILNLDLVDMMGGDLLDQLAADGIKIPPVVAYSEKSLTHEEELKLHKYTDSIILKGAKSQERLLEETSLFLHRMVSDLPASQQQVITHLLGKDKLFIDKKILLVDDDMRNLFSLSKIMTERGIITLKAENGMKALEILQTDPDIDMVLMDIMMPVMDGYETMMKIREDKRFKDLPILALTAKAMTGDRQKSIEAGANDYLTKPLDIDRLFSMLRVWLQY